MFGEFWYIDPDTVLGSIIKFYGFLDRVRTSAGNIANLAAITYMLLSLVEVREYQHCNKNEKETLSCLHKAALYAILSGLVMLG